MLPYIAEFLGTMILIILGNGVVTNVTPNKSGMKGVGSIQITFAQGLAVMLLAFIFGTALDAHFNPALTIALVVDGGMTWGPAPGYIVAQSAGVFMGIVIAYLLSEDQYGATESTAIKLGTFYTGSSIPNMGHNILSEAVGTFVPVLAIKGIGQVAGIAPGVDKLLTFGITVPIGMSLGGLTGYAINPAHDLGPRLIHTVLPTKGKSDPSWGYAPVVIIGPVVGAVAAVLLYQTIPWM